MPESEGVCAVLCPSEEAPKIGKKTQMKRVLPRVSLATCFSFSQECKHLRIREIFTSNLKY